MVTCNGCGQQWKRDPALEVVCPVPACKAGIGVKCRVGRPSEHKLNPAFANTKDMHDGVHDERDRLAMKMVPGYGKCSKSEKVEKPAKGKSNAKIQKRQRYSKK